MKNIGQMMQQAQEMQSKMADIQDKLSHLEIEGSSGAGLIKVTLSGKNDVRKIKIDASLIDPEEPDILEDLLIAAFNDAKSKVESEVNSKMSEVTGGLQLPPGFKLPF